MAIEFVRSTRDNHTEPGALRWVAFGSAVAFGDLVVTFSCNEGAADTLPPTAPAGWVECLATAPYEGNKSPGRLFAKICDGGADFNADGRVGPFTHQSSAGLIGAQFSGAGSATPSYADVPATEVKPAGTFDTTLSPTVALPGSLLLMVQQGQFGDQYVFSAVSPSSDTTPGSSPGTPGSTLGLHYRIGGPGDGVTGRVASNTSSMWYQAGVAVFDPGEAPVPEDGAFID